MIPTALVTSLGVLCGGRVYPVKLPEQATLPAITYQKISNTEGQTHDGYDSTSEQRYQITVWDDKYSDIKTLAESVKAALRTFAGSGTEAVAKSSVVMEIDAYEPDVNVHQVVIDAMLLVET